MRELPPHDESDVSAGFDWRLLPLDLRAGFGFIFGCCTTHVTPRITLSRRIKSSKVRKLCRRKSERTVRLRLAEDWPLSQRAR